MKRFIGVIKLLRIKHYLKNGLILLPLFFAQKLFDPELLLKCFIGIIAFSFISSAVYIMNDIRDRESDRNHSTKCKRPIASGVVPVWLAACEATALVAFSVALLILLKSLFGALCAIVYIVINIGYSFGLKNIPIVDIMLLVSGFVIRLLFGGIICGISISPWLLVTVICAAFYMGFGKRRGEIVKEGDSTRRVNKRYSVEFLDEQMAVFMALILVFYSLWCITVSQNNFEWSVIIVMLIFVRYSYLVKGNTDGDPVSVLLGDPFLITMVVVYCVYVFVIMYLPVNV